MKVASIQMVSTASVDENIAQAWQLLEQAAAAGAELAILPEYFCLIGQRDADKLAIAETFGATGAAAPLQTFLANAAREWGLWIVGGTIPLHADQPDRVFNSSLVFNPAGECVARYDKIHLFCFNNGRESYDESRVLQAGTQPVRFALPSRDGNVWHIGVSVCYDLRFPELFRHYALANGEDGMDLLVLSAAFTYTTGQAHWEILLRARAIENLCFVAASAQGGTHPNGRQTWGQSLLIEPWGAVAAQQAQGAGVVCAELDFARLNAVRTQLPALQHGVL